MFPTEVANQYYDAQRLYAEGKAAQALAILDAIDRLAPNHPEIMHARALCLHATDNLREAVRLCNQLYTMHRDRRGLELRNRWTNPRWAAPTVMRVGDTSVEAQTFDPPAAASAPAAAPAGSALDAAFLREAVFLCVGLGAEPRPEPVTAPSQLPRRLLAAGCSIDDYNAALAHRFDTCLPAAARLLAAARAAGRPILFLQWGFHCPDGTDLSPNVFPRFREDHGADARAWPGHPGALERLPAPELAPAEADRVLLFTGDDPFTSSNLRYVIQNLGARNLILLGGPAEQRINRALATGAKRGHPAAVAVDATYALREPLRLPALEDASPAHMANTDALISLLQSR